MTCKLKLAVSIAAVLGVVVCADIVVCAKCGHEIGSGRSACGHCGAAVPGDSTQTKPGQSEPDGEYLDAELVEEDVEMGRRYMAEGDFEMAGILFRNAAAVELLVKPDPDGSRAKQILALMENCLSARTVKTKCPKCEGSGKAYMVSKSLSGETRTQEILGKGCPTCGGKGHVMAMGTVEDRKQRIGNAASRNTRLQQARKYAPVGGAWVPTAVADRLTLVQKTTLKRACVTKCDRCMGIGLQDCLKCKGSGTVECTNSDCEKGLVKLKSGGGLGNSPIVRSAKCPECGGDGRSICATCAGKGHLLCAKCNGTGDRPACRGCDGRGLVGCRRCRGSGNHEDAVCRQCGGTGIVECSSCNGDGHRK